VEEPSGVKILIVEDDADSGEALMHLLADFGHEVKLVMKPRLADVAAREFRPDVAIVDIGMPGMSGYELVRVLRALPQLSACRYLAVTAHAGVDMVRRSIEAGFDYHLTKPLPVPHLLRCLDGVV
jgi:CheY-like chemotaxis protein